MFQIDSFSLPHFLTGDEGSVGAEVGECDFIAIFGDGAVFAAEAFIVDADEAVGTASDEYLILSEEVGGEDLVLLYEGDEPAPVVSFVECKSLCFFQRHLLFIVEHRLIYICVSLQIRLIPSIASI